MSWILVVLLAIIIVGSVYTLIKEYRGECNYGAISSSILTIGLIITAVYGFYVTNQSTRMQTSMDFCMSMFQTFQSKEYIEREHLIWSGLEKRGECYCSIGEIEDSELRDAVYEYCELMNGVGAMVFEHMINIDLVVAYLGTNTLKTYLYIKPYLELTRKERESSIPERYSNDDKTIIHNAETLAFAHFELLALKIKNKAPNMIKKYEKEIRKGRRKVSH